MTKPRICVVTGGDSKYFHQIQACIDSLHKWFSPIDYDLKVIGIDLSAQDLAWLDARARTCPRMGNLSIEILTDVSSFPKNPTAPNYVVSLTCRPFLRETFPGYEAYLWVDSDIRFLAPDGLQYWLTNSLDPSTTLAIAHQNEPSYFFNTDADQARGQGLFYFNRILRSYGPDTAEYLRYFKMHNAGIWGARADSPIWRRYRRNFEKKMAADPNDWFEQEAINVALVEVGGIRDVPTIYNWMALYSIPLRTSDGSWVSPMEPTRKISVIHLVLSANQCLIPGNPGTMYEYYKKIGLTA